MFGSDIKASRGSRDGGEPGGAHPRYFCQNYLSNPPIWPKCAPPPPFSDRRSATWSSMLNKLVYLNYYTKYCHLYFVCDFVQPGDQITLFAILRSLDEIILLAVWYMKGAVFYSLISSLKTYHRTLHFYPLVTGPVHSCAISTPRGAYSPAAVSAH